MCAFLKYEECDANAMEVAKSSEGKCCIKEKLKLVLKESNNFFSSIAT